MLIMNLQIQLLLYSSSSTPLASSEPGCEFLALAAAGAGAAVVAGNAGATGAAGGCCASCGDPRANHEHSEGMKTMARL